MAPVPRLAKQQPIVAMAILHGLLRALALRLPGADPDQKGLVSLVKMMPNPEASDRFNVITSRGNEKPKLLFVIYSLVGGGAEKVFLSIINFLDKSKYDIRVVIIKDIIDYPDALDPAIKLHCLDKRGRLDLFKVVYGLHCYIRDYGPDAVMAFDHYANLITVLAGRFFNRVPRVVISERNYPDAYLQTERLSWLKRLLLKLLYAKADCIVSVSEAIRANLIESYDLPFFRIKTIFNPLAIEEIQVFAEQEIRHSFFSENETLVVITAGRLAEQKRFDRLLYAFAAVSRSHANARLIILGKGPLEGFLKELAVRLKIDSFVAFAGFQANPYAWMRRADIFVLSSDFEGFPNVLAEAMACGTAVVSTDCRSGPSEIITNRINGILVPTNDADALAQAIMQLLQNEALRQHLARQGQLRVRDFRIDKIGREYEHVLYPSG